TPNVWRPDRTFETAATVQTNLIAGLVRTIGDLTIWFVVVLVPYLIVLALLVVVVRWFVSVFGKWIRIP
ncbi:MAG: hypothetical protein ABI874_00695, partial [Chloroflexota bacterium]